VERIFLHRGEAAAAGYSVACVNSLIHTQSPDGSTDRGMLYLIMLMNPGMIHQDPLIQIHGRRHDSKSAMAMHRGSEGGV